MQVISHLCYADGPSPKAFINILNRWPLTDALVLTVPYNTSLCAQAFTAWGEATVGIELEPPWASSVNAMLYQSEMDRQSGRLYVV